MIDKINHYNVFSDLAYNMKNTADFSMVEYLRKSIEIYIEQFENVFPSLRGVLPMQKLEDEYFNKIISSFETYGGFLDEGNSNMPNSNHFILPFLNFWILDYIYYFVIVKDRKNTIEANKLIKSDVKKIENLLNMLDERFDSPKAYNKLFEEEKSKKIIRVDKLVLELEAYRNDLVTKSFDLFEQGTYFSAKKPTKKELSVILKAYAEGEGLKKYSLNLKQLIDDITFKD